MKQFCSIHKDNPDDVVVFEAESLEAAQAIVAEYTAYGEPEEVLAAYTFVGGFTQDEGIEIANKEFAEGRRPSLNIVMPKDHDALVIQQPIVDNTEGNTEEE